MNKELRQVKEEYFPRSDPENLKAYVDKGLAYNQQECAEETGITRPTLRNFRDTFAEMSKEERAILIQGLAEENRNDVSKVNG